MHALGIPVLCLFDPFVKLFEQFSWMQPVDKQSLLDSGILCCLIHILNALLDPSETSQTQKPADHEGLLPAIKDYDSGVGQVRRLEVSLSLAHSHTCTFLWMLGLSYACS